MTYSGTHIRAGGVISVGWPMIGCLNTGHPNLDALTRTDLSLNICCSFGQRVLAFYITVQGLSGDSQQGSRVFSASSRAAQGLGTEAACNLVDDIRHVLTIGKPYLVEPLAWLRGEA